MGILAFPLAWFIFKRLPDRGYGMSRALGLLFSGYILWLGASLGFLRNNLGGVIGALIILAVVSILILRREGRDIWQWIKENRGIVLTVEILFFASFLLWSLYRAFDPEIVHTEQPMDLAFLNGILNSETFPPKDPWLSGYAISYYYFGYVLLAFMTRVTGVIASEAFNLGNALWFTLSILGAYSIVLNLVSIGKEKVKILSPLLGPLFVTITGNLEILFELLHQNGHFWKQPITRESTSTFWTWLNIEALIKPPLNATTSLPNRHWWWWQASRVVYDSNLAGSSIEMIDEFPFFSFLLADNHPHVLALPFVLLAIAFALNVYHGRFDQSYRLATIGQNIQVNRIWRILLVIVFIIGICSSIAILISGGGQAEALQSTIKILFLGSILGIAFGIWGLTALGRFEVALPQKEFWIGAWIFGALAFLNTWDFPFYLSLLFLIILWNQWNREGKAFLTRFMTTAFGLVVTGILFYLPWYPTFSSQASGILPNLTFPTRFVHFLIMFGPLIVPVFVWLVQIVVSEHPVERNRTPLFVAIFVPIGLFLLSLGLGVVAYLVIRNDPVVSGEVFSHLGLPGLDPESAFREVIAATFSRRLSGSWTTILLAIMLFMIARLVIHLKSKSGSTKEVLEGNSIFVIFLIGIGTLLILGPEFVYLRDSFGHRMNTIFKFYYATWIMWGISAAYATIHLWPKKWTWKTALQSLVLLPLLVGLLYPAIAIWTKSDQFQSAYGPTLDGMAYRERSTLGEYEAIQWINENLQEGIVAEAVGGSYTAYARISTHTGLSTLLGWPGHELQWRGGSEEQGTRQIDVENLYTTRSWQEAKNIVDQYGIDYVYIGPLERSTYTPLVEEKFSVFMDEIFRNDEVIIFAINDQGVGS